MKQEIYIFSRQTFEIKSNIDIFMRRWTKHKMVWLLYVRKDCRYTAYLVAQKPQRLYSCIELQFIEPLLNQKRQVDFKDDSCVGLQTGIADGPSYASLNPDALLLIDNHKGRRTPVLVYRNPPILD